MAQFTLGDAILNITGNAEGLNRSLGMAQREAQSKFGNIIRMSQNAGKAMGAAGLAMSAGFVAAAKSAATFDTAMREVNTLLGLNDAEFVALKGEVKDLAQLMGVDAVDASKALYQAISASVPRDNAIEFMRIAAESAIGGITDMETAVDGLTTVMNAFKIPASEASRVSDIMFATMKGGKTTIGELSRSLFNVAPIAASTGVSFEEVSAAISTLTKQGTPTSVATTQIRQAIISLQKPNGDMAAGLARSADALIEMGAVSGEVADRHQELAGQLAELEKRFASGQISQGDFNKASKDLGKAMAENAEGMGVALLKAEGLSGAFSILRETTQANDTEMANMVGSAEALAAILGMTGENAAMFASDMDAIKNSTNATHEAFLEMDEGMGRRWQRMIVDLKLLSITIGEAVLPAISWMVEMLKPVVAAISAWAEENPELIRQIAMIGAGLAVGGPVLVGLGMMAGSINSITTATKLLTAALLKNPLFAASAAIVAGVLAVNDSMTKFSEGAADVHNWISNIHRKLLEMWSPLKAINDAMWDLVSAAASLPGNVIDFFQGETGSPISSMPGRQFGGPVFADQPYLVGERGPEIYVPDRSGTIIPNDKIGGAGGIHIGQITIVANDPADFERKLRTRALMAGA